LAGFAGDGIFGTLGVSVLPNIGFMFWLFGCNVPPPSLGILAPKGGSAPPAGIFGPLIGVFGVAFIILAPPPDIILFLALGLGIFSPVYP
jgi:hypothetical protein